MRWWLAAMVAMSALALGGAARAELRCPRGAEPRTQGLLEQCETRAGVPHGPWVLRYDATRIMRRGAYHRGKPDGAYRAWYPSGKLAEERHYRRGRPVGVWQRWTPGGRLVERAAYRRGRRHGSREEWYEDGQPRLREQYRNGIPAGVHWSWDEHGELTWLRAYHRRRALWFWRPVDSFYPGDCSREGVEAGIQLAPVLDGDELEHARSAIVDTCRRVLARDAEARSKY